MYRPVYTMPLQVVATAGQNGASVDVSEWTKKAVFIDGTFVATLQIQVSPDVDGATWFSSGSTITAKGLVEIAEPCYWVRVRTTVFVSGVPTAKLSGVVG